MGSGQLILFGFVLVYARLVVARSQSMRMPTYWGVEVQTPAEVEAKPAAGLEREHSMESAQQAGRPQPKQIQPPAQPLSWKFPEHPVDPVNKPPVQLELRQPVTTNRVAVRCGESRIQVEVSQDLLGRGKLMKPEEITLGGCSATEIDDMSHVLVFEYKLHSCGSKLTMTESNFIYAFALVYNPKVSVRSPIIRSQSTVIGVECHYPRKHMVSKRPLGIPNKQSEVAEGQLSFSLQLMTDDWKFERTSSKYMLGDVINIQASVMQHPDPLLRVLVDSCVATMRPDATSAPRHAVIKNHGCLSDQNRSRFMPQSQLDKLQFQLEAPSFGLMKMMYLICQLKAIPALSPVTNENKSCYFDKRWRAVGGKDQFCTCCKSSCGMRKTQHLDEYTGKWQAELTLGPIFVKQ